MDNLLSGLLGAVIGAAISSLISMWQFQKQMRFESNRRFLEQLIQELQNIYTAQLSQLEITDKSINTINAFQVLTYKELEILQDDLDKLKDAILRYREGRKKSLVSTSTSMEEVHARENIKTYCTNIIQKIRRIT